MYAFFALIALLWVMVGAALRGTTVLSFPGCGHRRIEQPSSSYG